MILLIDNYDSFVHNLARYLRRLGQETLVVRNDAVTVDEIRGQTKMPSAIVLSPGPCTPTEAGCCLSVVRELADSIPILGVCLGHQVIAAALGGQVVRAREPMHGRPSPVFHDGQFEFAGLPNPLTVGRYHSLVVDRASLPPELEVSAQTADGVIMALRHRTRLVVGLQFHPESILTEHGFEMLANFLRRIPLPCAERTGAEELAVVDATSAPLPSVPVTF